MPAIETSLALLVVAGREPAAAEEWWERPQWRRPVAIVRAEDKNGGAVNSRYKAGRCHHRHRAHSVTNRPASARVENMPIADTLMSEMPRVVARRGDGPAADAKPAPAASRLATVLNADMPKRVLTIAAERKNVAPQVDECITDAVLTSDFR